MYKNLKINVGQIYEGWKNKLLPDADMVEQIELVSAERMAICDACPNHSNNHKHVHEARSSVGLVRRDQGMRVEMDDLYDHFDSVNIISVKVKDPTIKNQEEKNVDNEKENLQQSLDDFF